mmetsp:Transcript_68811/g.128414  ORF Transcript_68811/g.128414 Transcript_68811/m.128414 type:complete len:413 (+) Transcript_68811:119-1357(+)
MATSVQDAAAAVPTAVDAPPAADFDLEATILRFLSDEAATTLELPRTLTAEQRKQTRRLADQHPGVKCESFGFGAERQLHLFKQGEDRLTQELAADSAGGSSVRVKNTFIDDWEGGSNEPVQFRSMPVSLLQRTLQRCFVEAGAGKLDLQTTVEELQTESASSPRSEAANPADIDLAAQAAELPPLPDGLKVRNTFIHIETMPAVNRIVQSMPDGMFQQCLEAELSAQSEATASQSSAAPAPSQQAPSKAPSGPPLLQTSFTNGPPTAAPLTTPKIGMDPGSAQPPPPSREAPDPAAQNASLSPGAEVEITRLLKLPDFNGLSGIIQSYDAGSGRYDVLLNSATGTAGWRWVKVKAENLIARVPPPPSRDAPTIVTDADTSALPLDTPKWEEDYAVQGQARTAATLKLNALV